MCKLKFEYDNVVSIRRKSFKIIPQLGLPGPRPSWLHGNLHELSDV